MKASLVPRLGAQAKQRSLTSVGFSLLNFFMPYIANIVCAIDTWQGHPHPGMVLKIFKAPLFFKQTEVEALKDVNLLIASGEVGGKHVIAMHKANGESLEAIFASLGHDKTKIETFMKPLRSKIAHEVAQIAKTKGIFQNDLHSGNVSFWVLASQCTG